MVRIRKEVRGERKGGRDREREGRDVRRRRAAEAQEEAGKRALALQEKMDELVGLAGKVALDPYTGDVANEMGFKYEGGLVG